MENNVQQVQIGLSAVNEKTFRYHPEKLSDNFDPKLIKMSFTNGINGLNVEKNMISIVFGAKYSYENQDILECVYSFDFGVKDLKRFVTVNPNKSVKIDVIMPHLINTAIGTLRGIILVNTEGSPLRNYPLPMINAEQMLKGMANMQKK